MVLAEKLEKLINPVFGFERESKFSVIFLFGRKNSIFFSGKRRRLPFISCVFIYTFILITHRHETETPLDENRSPFTRRGYGRSYGDLSVPESDISFVSSGRPSIDRMFPNINDMNDPNRTPPRLSNLSDMDYGPNFESSSNYGRRSVDVNSPTDLSSGSFENERFSSASAMVRSYLKYHLFDLYSLLRL